MDSHEREREVRALCAGRQRHDREAEDWGHRGFTEGSVKDRTSVKGIGPSLVQIPVEETVTDAKTG